MGRDAAQLLDEAEGRCSRSPKARAKSEQGFLAMPEILAEVTDKIDLLQPRQPG